MYLCTAGRENTEKRRDGYVCNSACYNVPYNDSSLDTEGNHLLVILLLTTLSANIMLINQFDANQIIGTMIMHFRCGDLFLKCLGLTLLAPY